MANRDNVKPWFQQGDKPNQQQFYQLFDWLRFTDDEIDMADIEGLTDALQAKADAAAIQAISDVAFPAYSVRVADFAITVKAGFELEIIRFKPDANITLKIGTSFDGGELWPGEIEYEAGQWHRIDLNQFDDVDRNLFFNGVTASTQFYLYKR